MILYIENPKDSTKKLLGLTHEFSKVLGYNMSRNQLHFYTAILAIRKGKKSHLQLHQKNYKVQYRK